MDQQPDQQTKKLGLITILGYIVGGFLYLSATGMLFSGKGFGAIMIACAGCLIFPPSMKFFRSKTKIELSRGLRIAGAFGCFMIFAMSQSDKEVRQTLGKDPSSSQSTQQVAEVKPQEPVIAETCREVSDIFDSQSNLTDLQKDEIWSQKYRNKKFEWDLQVVEVSKAILGSGYVVQFKCTNSRSFVQDIQVEFPEEAKDYVLSLNLERVYKVRGKFERQSTLIGLSAEAELDERSPASN